MNKFIDYLRKELSTVIGLGIVGVSAIAGLIQLHYNSENAKIRMSRYEVSGVVANLDPESRFDKLLNSDDEAQHISSFNFDLILDANTQSADTLEYRLVGSFEDVSNFYRNHIEEGDSLSVISINRGAGRYHVDAPIRLNISLDQLR